MNRIRLYRLALVLMSAVQVIVLLAYTWEHERNRTLTKRLYEQNQHLVQWQAVSRGIEQDLWGQAIHRDLTTLETTPATLRAAFDVEKIVHKNNIQGYDCYTSERIALISQAERWEFAARAMSAEADRRHLDKSFPRVNALLLEKK